jgi:hypothetical protein
MRALIFLLLVSGTAYGQANKCIDSLKLSDPVIAYLNCSLGPNLKPYDSVRIRTGIISHLIDGITFPSTKVVALNTGDKKAICVVTIDSVNKSLIVPAQGHASVVFEGKEYSEERDSFLCATKR